MALRLDVCLGDGERGQGIEGTGLWESDREGIAEDGDKSKAVWSG